MNIHMFTDSFKKINIGRHEPVGIYAELKNSVIFSLGPFSYKKDDSLISYLADGILEPGKGRRLGGSTIQYDISASSSLGLGSWVLNLSNSFLQRIIS